MPVDWHKGSVSRNNLNFHFVSGRCLRFLCCFRSSCANIAAGVWGGEKRRRRQLNILPCKKKKSGRCFSVVDVYVCALHFLVGAVRRAVWCLRDVQRIFLASLLTQLGGLWAYSACGSSEIKFTGKHLWLDHNLSQLHSRLFSFMFAVDVCAGEASFRYVHALCFTISCSCCRWFSGP